MARQSRGDTSIKHSYSPGQFVVGSPVFICNVTIKDDNGTDVLLLDVNNISGKTLRSLYLNITVYDDVGDQIGTCTFAYQGLSTATGEALPQDKPFNLNTNVAYTVDITCEKAAFTDDTVWRKEGNPTIYSVPEKAELLPKNFAQYKYLRVLLAKKSTIKPSQKLFYPAIEETHRLCICGNPAAAGSKCLACGLDEADLQEVMDHNVLIQCRKDMIAKVAKERTKALQRFREQILEETYQKARALLEEATESSYKRAAEIFATISDYKDANQLEEQCRNQYAQSVYNRAKALISKISPSKVSYETALSAFLSIKDWADSSEYIALCREKIADLVQKEESDRLERERQAEIARQEKLREEKLKKTTRIVAAIVACIAIVLAILGINAHQRNEATAALVGRTFKGACYGRYYTWEYQIEFLSDSRCKIITVDQSRNGNTTHTEEITIPNAHYQVEGGLFGLTLAFDDWQCDGADPFEIQIEGNTITIYTPNYNSGYSMTLKESK